MALCASPERAAIQAKLPEFDAQELVDRQRSRSPEAPELPGLDKAASEGAAGSPATHGHRRGSRSAGAGASTRAKPTDGAEVGRRGDGGGASGHGDRGGDGGRGGRGGDGGCGGRGGDDGRGG
ncbi:uncharacterized protein LOC133890180 [Phragmites australis]|uniref:uncharacterized protein LOC133890180 n=1 Tax=Phragmites australis TaxID=29695 RepID=UPI002D76E688|nr:uncharacterized protein LOC133890180 [Phragmites australis]